MYLKPESVHLNTFPFHAISIFDDILVEIIKAEEVETSFERFLICCECAKEENETFFLKIDAGFHPQTDLEKCSNSSSETTISHKMNENQRSLMKKDVFFNLSFPEEIPKIADDHETSWHGVNRVIGEKCLNILFEEIRSGQVKERDLQYMADEMHKHVVGEFVKKSAVKNIDLVDIMRPMLVKWYETEEWYKLNDGEGFEILIKILEDKTNFELGPMVKQMKVI